MSKLDGKAAIAEIKAAQKQRKRDSLKPYERFVGYLLFGSGSIVTSLIATYAVFQHLNLTGWQLWVVCSAIAITMTPAAVATGRYIIQGALNEARR